MSNDDNHRGSDSLSSDGALLNTRRAFLGTAAVLGLGAASTGATGKPGNGDTNSQFAVREHDHSGTFNASSHLGAIAPVDSIRVTDIINTEQPVFDVRAFGAVGDGEHDDTQAIEAAIDAASVVEPAGTVLIPRGDWLASRLNIKRENNGVTITGVGYGTHLMARDCDFNSRMFMLNDGFERTEPGCPPGGIETRSEEPIRDITIKNLRVDGRKDLFDDKWTGFGIQCTGQGVQDENILIQNVWAHDWNTTGINVSMGGVTVDSCFCYDNGLHGIGIGAFNDDLQGTRGQLISNVHCHGNGQYGIDSSGGKPQIMNFYCSDNGWGMKCAGPDITSFVNGRLYNNENHGFQMTNPSERVYMHNVESRNNGRQGFRFASGGNIFIGTIASIGDNQDLIANSSVAIQDPQAQQPWASQDMNVIADKVFVESGAGDGVIVQTNAQFRVDDLTSIDNAGDGLRQQDGADELVVRGGEIRDNGGAGIRFNGAGRSLVSGVRLSGNQDGPVAIASGASPQLASLDGFETENGGVATLSGDGSATVFAVDHGLAETPTQLDVTSDLSSDATSVAGVQNVGSTSFEVVFDSAPAAGTDNVSVWWSASVY